MRCLKGSLPREVVETRVKQFVDRGLPLVLTTVPKPTRAQHVVVHFVRCFLGYQVWAMIHLSDRCSSSVAHAFMQVPMFTQRAETFPGSTFVVGFDTAIRLINTKYYANR